MSQPPVVTAAPAAVAKSRGRGYVAAQLFVVALILVAAVGGAILLLGGKAPAGNSPAASQPPAIVAQECASAMKDLTDALTEIDSRLEVGMTYAVYSDHVATARVAYDRLKPAQLTADCLIAVGTPEENALNEYITAYTLWNDCIGKTGCTTDSIKSELQGHWTTATTILSGVKAKLP